LRRKRNKKSPKKLKRKKISQQLLRAKHHPLKRKAKNQKSQYLMFHNCKYLKFKSTLQLMEINI
jgi:hypothetical protein